MRFDTAGLLLFALTFVATTAAMNGYIELALAIVLITIGAALFVAWRVLGRPDPGVIK